MQEFNQQVACEEKNGIKVSEFMRIGNDMAKIKTSQVGFISLIVLPLWNQLSIYVENIEDFPVTVKVNKKKWQEIENFE